MPNLTNKSDQRLRELIQGTSGEVREVYQAEYDSRHARLDSVLFIRLNACATRLEATAQAIIALRSREGTPDLRLANLAMEWEADLTKLKELICLT